ncbi:hypothetical protein PIB30_093835, partial [Stylosanthes scabra]|nr:hypothetical protein [Stylosanthes scabra]
LAVAMTRTPQPVSPQVCEKVPNPHVEEALQSDDSDDELAMIKGDSDDNSGPIPTRLGGSLSFDTQQYSPHLSNLNLDALFGLGPRDGDSSSGARVS